MHRLLSLSFSLPFSCSASKRPTRGTRAKRPEQLAEKGEKPGDWSTGGFGEREESSDRRDGRTGKGKGTSHVTQVSAIRSNLY